MDSVGFALLGVTEGTYSCQMQSRDETVSGFTSAAGHGVDDGSEGTSTAHLTTLGAASIAVCPSATEGARERFGSADFSTGFIGLSRLMRRARTPAEQWLLIFGGDVTVP